VLVEVLGNPFDFAGFDEESGGFLGYVEDEVGEEDWVVVDVGAAEVEEPGDLV